MTLRVEPATAEHLRALLAEPGVFSDRYGLRVVEGYLEFDCALAHSLDRLTGEGVDPSWLTHLFVHDEDRALIGIGGFKRPPAGGAVEIGYGIARAYRNRGFATAAARTAEVEDAGVGTVWRWELGLAG